MVEDSEDTIIRPRRAPGLVSLSAADAMADTVLAPPPVLVEPPEPPRRARPLPASAPAPAPSTDPVMAVPTVSGTTTFHQIRVGGSVFSLEVPAFVGRHPSTPRVMGGRAVRLVRVPSPSREVSATHASFQQEGTSVVVTDLGSTNGTVVSSPQSEPVVLRQGDSIVVLPGGRIMLGDSVVVEVLGTSGADD